MIFAHNRYRNEGKWGSKQQDNRMEDISGSFFFYSTKAPFSGISIEFAQAGFGGGDWKMFTMGSVSAPVQI